MKTYYRVFDHQVGNYFATGYNAESMQDLINDFRSYISVGDENNNYQTWEQIADYLQEVTIEKSSEPFEELN